MRDGEEKKRKFFHRTDAEWIDEEVCNKYRQQALAMKLPCGSERANAEWKKLSSEFAYRYDIPILMAENIMLGIRMKEYCALQMYLKEQIALELTSTKKTAYDEEKEAFERWKYEQQLKAEAEIQHALGEYDFEE